MSQVIKLGCLQILRRLVCKYVLTGFYNIIAPKSFL